MTRARETRGALSNIDDAVEHRYEDKRAGLFQNSGELAVQLREKATRIGRFNCVGFDHGAHHRRDQRCADAMAHYIANTNGGRIFVKPCDMKEIAAHLGRRQITVTKAEPRFPRGCICRKNRIGVRHECLLQFRRHSQICFHLLVFLANLAVALFDFPNVRQQKCVLNLEKRFGTDESKESAVFIDQ